MDVNIREMGKLNQPSIRSPYNETKFSKKAKYIVAKLRFSRLGHFVLPVVLVSGHFHMEILHFHN